MTAVDEKLIVGKISGVYGVKGWIKVYSDTDPRERIADYNPWYLKLAGEQADAQWREVRIEAGRPQAKTIIVKIEGCDDRDAAMQLTGAVIGIRQDQLQALDNNEFYWRDLIGLRVTNKEGVELGTVQRLMETGANDVLVVRAQDRESKERLIPWTLGQAVLDVDLEQGLIQVDWDADF